MADDVFQIKKFGDWAKTETVLHRMATEMERSIGTATRKNALMLERALKKGIQSSAPGGKKFKKLHPFTIAEKGSSKPLVDSGELMNAITHRMISKFDAMVGLLRNAPHAGARGTAIGLINLGWLHEHGYAMKVTPRMRAVMGKRGLRIGESTTVIKVPARPFVRPIYEDHAMQLAFVAEYDNAVKKLFKL